MRTWSFFGLLWCVGSALNALAATFTVVNNNDSGAGSLRQAIFDANDTPGKDIVQFNILPGGLQTIALFVDGPDITDPVMIDGSSQPGFVNKPIIVLAGSEDSSFGLRIATSNCTIRSLVISNFAGSGILIEANARGNIIGGTNSGNGNTIVSNLVSGVAVVSGTNNAIRGNSIFGNGGLGIDLQNDGVTLNDDKDLGLGPNDLQNFPVLASASISSSGVAISGSLNSRPNTIFQIDFFANQACDKSGYGQGQTYLGSRLVTTPFGGTVGFNVTLATPFSGRYISATATDPFLNTSEFSRCVLASSTLAPVNFSVVNTNDEGPGSFRQAILDANVRVSFGTNRIHFNIPGTDLHTVAPISPLPAILESVVIDGYTQPGTSLNTLSNGFNGRLLIRLNGADSGAGSVGLALLGNNSAVRGLVILGFAGGGIQVLGARTNQIQGNLIGLDVDGSALGNGLSQGADLTYPGVLLLGSTGSAIGGFDVATRNIICASGAEGIHISGADSTGNQVLGNFIGIDASGMVGLGNGSWGMRIEGRNNALGGTAVGAGNLISWNGDGVLISGGFSNLVQGNLIGCDVSARSALGNGSGVRVLDSSYSLIGGTNAAARNVIVANGRGGVEIVGATSGNNVVQGNSIGTDAAGQLAMGNGSFGVRCETAGANLLGGTNSGAGNTIAFNHGNGAEILGGVNNAILGNSIFGNDGLGIDLEGDGPTANDPGDSDTGANQLQNFPELTAAFIQANQTIIEGALDALPRRAFLIQLFVNDGCDDSGYGEGQAYLASVDVVTDSGGHATFSYTNVVPLVAGRFVSATATDADNNTSEFSACLRVVSLDVVDLALTVADFPDPAGLSSDLTYTITVLNGGPASATTVVVTDHLPAAVSFVSAASSQGSCSSAAGIVTCQLNTIKAGASAAITLKVLPLRGGPAVNLVSVTADQVDTNPENNSASESTQLGIADVGLILTPSPDPVQIGGVLTYSLTVTNLGPDPSTDLVATVVLPAGMTFVSASAPAGDCVVHGETVNCKFSSLTSRSSVQVAITVEPTLSGTFLSAANVTGATSDPNSSNNGASANVTVIPARKPLLSFRTGIDGCVLEWSAGTLPGFVLETTTSLTPPATWTVIPNATSPFVVTNKLDDGTRFYRMRLP